MQSTPELSVDPTNADQFRAWDGDEGSYWAANAGHFERALVGYDGQFFEAASIGSTDSVLDVGCGTGHTTRTAARAASSGSVLGVDLSSAMLDVARQRSSAEGLSNVRFVQADVQVHRFEQAGFDAVLGHTSAMFFGDRVAALTNLGCALRPGGRLVLLTWQPFEENEWIREFTVALSAGQARPSPTPDSPGPFTMSDPATIRALLQESGYTKVSIDGLREPMWFGDDTADAHRLLAGLMAWMLEGLETDQRGRALDALRATIAAHETSDGVLYSSATWLVRAERP